jgi:two-component system, OmpR family, phosphate regulon sensor histidine kinase PhoR
MLTMQTQLTDPNNWVAIAKKNKNQTPRTLSFRAAFTSALFIGLALIAFKYLGWITISWKIIGFLLASIVMIDYFTNYYYIQYYIYRKIKVIYKTIHRKKNSTDLKSANLNMNSNILEEVEKEVEEWERENDADLQRLEALAAYRRQFIGNVSHELKTPIFNVQGYIHTLLDGAIHDPEVNITYLQKAAKNADRLQTIVEDLDTINRLENGQMILETREFDIRALVEDVFGDLEMKAVAKEVKLQFKEGADHHFIVHADRDSIRQVLINLIQNSIKYGNKGGVTKLSFYDMDKYILVEVSDNGIGIDEKHHKHLFDRFYRVDKGRSRDVGGTGLGLAIAKHILEAHGQNISVRSEVGKGSTFGFTLEKVG